jgi:hypothetical protein
MDIIYRIERTAEEVRFLAALRRDIWAVLLYLVVFAVVVGVCIRMFGDRPGTRVGLLFVVVMFVLFSAAQACVYAQLRRSCRLLMRYRAEQLREDIHGERRERQDAPRPRSGGWLGR